MYTTRLVPTIVGVLITAQSISAIGATIDIVASADGFVRLATGATDSTSDIIEVNEVLTQRSRGLFEFNLAAVPPEAEIVSATFLVTAISAFGGEPSSPPTVQVEAYSGDGSIQTSDGTLPAIAIGQRVLLPLPFQEVLFQLNAAFIQDFASPQLGLRLRPIGTELENTQIRVASLEDQTPSTVNPTLRLVTREVSTVPEPATVLFVGIGLAGLGARWSRK